MATTVVEAPTTRAATENDLFAGLSGTHGQSLLVGILAAILLALVAGAVNGVLVAQLKMDPIIISLGTYTLLGGVLLFYTKGVTISNGLPESLGDWGSGRWLGVARPFWLLIAVGLVVAASGEQEIEDRIRQGLVYTETEAAFQVSRRRGDLIFEYNHTPPGDVDRWNALLGAIFGSVGERAVLFPPFHAGFGSNVHIGDDFFGNVNLTFVDDVDSRIGDGVMIAPSVTLTTTGHPVHPVHPDRRVDFARFSEPIVIEDKVWIGSNVVVRIGYGSVIGAGSTVSRDIPPMVVAAGTPCRVLRPITDEDLTTRTVSRV